MNRIEEGGIGHQLSDIDNALGPKLNTAYSHRSLQEKYKYNGRITSRESSYSRNSTPYKDHQIPQNKIS